MRIVIAADALLLRAGLIPLPPDVGHDVGAAGDASARMQAVGDEKPDIAVTDLRMPPNHQDEGLKARRADPLAARAAREREVLRLMAEGRPDTAIAATLVVSEAVEKHTSSIFSKLGPTPTAAGHRRVPAVLPYVED